MQSPVVRGYLNIPTKAPRIKNVQRTHALFAKSSNQAPLL